MKNLIESLKEEKTNEAVNTSLITIFKDNKKNLTELVVQLQSKYNMSKSEAAEALSEIFKMANAEKDFVK